MNSVQLLGNLARDPEVRYTIKRQGGCDFTIAASNTYIDSATNETKEQTAFVNCVAWGKLGEAVGNYRKGNRICRGPNSNKKLRNARRPKKICNGSYCKFCRCISVK